MEEVVKEVEGGWRGWERMGCVMQGVGRTTRRDRRGRKNLVGDGGGREGRGAGRNGVENEGEGI